MTTELGFTVVKYFYLRVIKMFRISFTALASLEFDLLVSLTVTPLLSVAELRHFASLVVKPLTYAVSCYVTN